MSRIKLLIPETVLATIHLQVRITDINYGGHLGNDSLAGILHEARVSWLALNDLSELNVGGPGLIMKDLSIEYIQESFYGDQLTISIAADSISSVGFELYYLVEANRNEKNIVIAKAKTCMLCFDYGVRKLAGIPEKLLSALQYPVNPTS